VRKDFVPCVGAELSVRLDARFYTRDEAPVGFVHWVVVEPPGFDVSGFVVAEPGLLARQVMVEPQHVEAATPEGDVLRLHLTRHEFEALPDHTPDNYVPPAPSWTDALRLGLGASAYVATEGHTGWARVAFRKGDLVTDRAGQQLGTAEGMCLDRDSRRLVATIARSSQGRLHGVRNGAWKVPADWLERLGDGRAHLSVDRDVVERSATHE
jgi:hypothetical protein